MKDDNMQVQLFEDLITDSEPQTEPKKKAAGKKAARSKVEEILNEQPVISDAKPDTPEKKAPSKKKETKVVSGDAPAKEKTAKKPNIILRYSNAGISRMDKVIKAIAFILALTVFLIFALAAVVLVLLDDLFLVISAIVLLLGVVISLIILFLIFGFGQIITQNNQILRRFNEMSDSDK